MKTKNVINRWKEKGNVFESGWKFVCVGDNNSGNLS